MLFFLKIDSILYFLILKTPSTKHFFEGSFKLVKSALLPNNNDNPPNKIDFPAPVSPVILVIPVLKLISNLSIKA